MNIQEIAKLAGVSISTVSKVMNGKDKDISEETRKKVLEVIEREHYVPYFKFLDKAGMKNRLVGLILQKNICENINIKIFAFFIDLILKSCYTATSGYLKMLILRHMLCDSYVFT